MDSHPLLQAPSQDTCAYFQRTSESASAPSSKCPTFPSERAAHYSRLFRFVNTSFRGGLRCFNPNPEGPFVEASRLLCQAFRFRQHPLARPLPPLPAPCHRSDWRREARERILDIFVKCAISFFQQLPQKLPHATVGKPPLPAAAPVGRSCGCHNEAAASSI